MVKTVACLTDGTFGSMAAWLHDQNAQFVFCGSHVLAVEAVLRGTADCAVIAVENSLDGAVTDGGMDRLIRQENLFIQGEVVIPIEQCLFVKPGTSLLAVKRLFSHPSALGQCVNYLEHHFPWVEKASSDSTIKAVQEMLASDVFAAAIAPRRAGKLYPVELVQAGIEDNPRNKTRFVVIGREDYAPTGHDKTSILFSLPDAVGALWRALGVFAQAQINMTRILSLPAKTELGEYWFLADIEGHRFDPKIAEALQELQRQVSAGQEPVFRMLGSYPRHSGQ